MSEIPSIFAVFKATLRPHADHALVAARLQEMNSTVAGYDPEKRQIILHCPDQASADKTEAFLQRRYNDRDNGSIAVYAKELTKPVASKPVTPPHNTSDSWKVVSCPNGGYLVAYPA